MAEGRRKAGWWALGPFIYGLFFLVAGVVVLSLNTITGVLFIALGVGALLVAWRAKRDISSDLGSGPLPGAIAPDKERAIKSTGVAGIATVKSFKYLGGSSAGTTLVELQLDVTTTRGGTVAVTKQLRVPLGASAKLAAGAKVPVTVSTSDPNDLVADWNALVSA